MIRGLGDVFESFPRPEPGRPGDAGMFGPGSMVWRVNGEAVTILGGGRALLMQIAHPSVAAGVADHSGFRTDPFGRLWHTLDSVLSVAFGDAEQSRAASARVNALHARVTGARDGLEYRALDPELLLWVHATLVDSALVTYERFVRPMSAAERGRYYEEVKRLSAAFDVPEGILPPTYAAFALYMGETVSGLSVGYEALVLSEAILRPPAPAALAPLAGIMRLATVGLLPPRLREGFGLEWSPLRELALDATAAASRWSLPLVPERVRRWPHALAAARRVRTA